METFLKRVLVYLIGLFLAFYAAFAGLLFGEGHQSLEQLNNLLAACTSVLPVLVSVLIFAVAQNSWSTERNLELELFWTLTVGLIGLSILVIVIASRPGGEDVPRLWIIGVETSFGILLCVVFRLIVVFVPETLNRYKKPLSEQGK